MLISGPGIKAGVPLLQHAITGHVDFAPTFITLAGEC